MTHQLKALLGSLIAILLLALFVQEGRIARYKANVMSAQAQFATYKEEQAQAIFRARALKEQQYLAERRKADETIKNLERELFNRDVEYERSERLRNEAERRLHHAEQSAHRAGSEETREAFSLCANLYRKLDKRFEELQSRIQLLSEYADRLEVELDACLKMN